MTVRMINYYAECGVLYGAFLIESDRIVGGSCIRYKIIRPIVLLRWLQRTGAF